MADVKGTAGSDTLVAFDTDDRIYAYGGDDVLFGGLGNDLLDGMTGADTMYGGAGNDRYRVDDAGDVASEDQNNDGLDDGGTELVESTISYTLGAFLENLTLTGTAAIDGTGNGLANKIKGNDAANFPGSQDGHIRTAALFPSGAINVMSPALSYSLAINPATGFNTLNLAYLRERVFYGN